MDAFAHSGETGKPYAEIPGNAWLFQKDPPKKSRLVLIGSANALAGHVIDPSLETLAAVVDPSGTSQGTTVEVQATDGPPVRVPSVRLEALAALDFDYLLFFDHKAYSGIEPFLKETGIKMGRAVLPEYYVRHLRGRQFYALEDEIQLFKLCGEIGVKSLLDLDMLLCRGPIYSRGNPWLQPIHPRIDGWLPPCAEAGIPPIYRNLYSRVRRSPSDLHLQSYTAILASDDRSRESSLHLLEGASRLSEWLIFYAGKKSFPYPAASQRELEAFGEVSCHPCTKGAFVAVRRKCQNDCRFYVVAHKACPIPPLPGCYQVIHAGKTDANAIGYPGDNSGDHIAELNPIINELSSAYWIWKNVSHAYVGLMHYRRYFAGSDGPSPAIMGEEEARRLLENHDIIVADEWLEGATNNSQILYDMEQDDQLNDLARELLLRNIRERQPGYVEAFQHVAFSQGLFKCNMMITRKRIFDAYCQWLFSFLLDAAREIKPFVEDLPFHKRRILGFWGERMLTVWLTMQDLRVKEVPMLTLSSLEQ